MKIKEEKHAMINDNIDNEKEEERGCRRLCPDCPMKNDEYLSDKS